MGDRTLDDRVSEIQGDFVDQFSDPIYDFLDGLGERGLIYGEELGNEEVIGAIRAHLSAVVEAVVDSYFGLDEEDEDYMFDADIEL